DPPLPPRRAAGRAAPDAARARSPACRGAHDHRVGDVVHRRGRDLGGAHAPAATRAARPDAWRRGARVRVRPLRAARLTQTTSNLVRSLDRARDLVLTQHKVIT